VVQSHIGFLSNLKAEKLQSVPLHFSNPEKGPNGRGAKEQVPLHQNQKIYKAQSGIPKKKVPSNQAVSTIGFKLGSVGKFSAHRNALEKNFNP
jgi:hypothetical protein